MQRICVLRGVIKNYAWGSRSALPELLGSEPGAEPQAELWLGAHPAGTALVMTDAGAVPLDAFIARDPVAVLGAATAQQFGASLPFLLKVLAADQPLSLQAHPNGAQARAGFERENAAGIALDAERRSFRDPNPKPELICALTPFSALCGFRPHAELLANLEALAAPELLACLAPLQQRGEAGLEAFCRALFGLDAATRGRLIDRALATARGRSGAEWRWLQKLAQAWPDDLGVLAPLWLELVLLAPGEALFLAAGCLHSYLEGVGVELMANSDNVLRGGLTRKHVDVPALLDTLVFRCGRTERLHPERVSEGVARYVTPAREFALSLLRSTPSEPVVASAQRSIEILLCSEGEGVVAQLGAPAQILPLRRGTTLLVPAASPAYRIEGRCSVWRAGVSTSTSVV